MNIGIKGSSCPFSYYNDSPCFYCNDNVNTIGLRLNIGKKFSSDLDLGASVLKVTNRDNKTEHLSSFVAVLSVNFPVITD